LERGCELAASLRGAWLVEPLPFTVDERTLASLAPLWDRHGVAPLIWRRIRSTAPPLPEVEQLRLAAYMSAFAVMVQQAALAQAVSTLRAGGVEPILLKGLSAGRHYPEPGLRPGGDLDLWVRPRDVTAARAAFRAAGYTPGSEWRVPGLNPNRFEDASNIGIDMTDRLFGVSPRLLRTFWRRTTVMTVADTPVRVLAPPDELVYLGIHAAKHLFGAAKWMVDIAALLSCWDTAAWGVPEPPEEQPARSWWLTAAGLALNLLGAGGDALPPDVRHAALREAAPWRRRVLEDWGAPATDVSNELMLRDIRAHLRAEPSPAGLLRLGRRLWPDPLEAATYLRRPLRPALAEACRPIAFAHRRAWSPVRRHLSDLTRRADAAVVLNRGYPSRTVEGR
jgi:hypothetical protein